MTTAPHQPKWDTVVASIMRRHSRLGDVDGRCVRGELGELEADRSHDRAVDADRKDEGEP